MKQPPMSLVERLELAAQACRAAHLLSCEATCREAAALLALPETEPSQAFIDLVEAARDAVNEWPASSNTDNPAFENAMAVLERVIVATDGPTVPAEVAPK